MPSIFSKAQANLSIKITRADGTVEYKTLNRKLSLREKIKLLKELGKN